MSKESTTRNILDKGGEVLGKMQSEIAGFETSLERIRGSIRSYANAMNAILISHLPAKYGIRSKFDRMAWPEDPVEKYMMISSWLCSPKIAKRIPDDWLVGTHFSQLLDDCRVLGHIRSTPLDMSDDDEECCVPSQFIILDMSDDE